MKRLPTSFSYSLLLLVVVSWLTGCSSRPVDATKSDQWPAIYPDYVGVTVPVDMAPLNFAMVDDSVTVIDVTVSGSKGTSLHSNGAETDFDIDGWHQLLADNQGDSLMVTVCAQKDGRWTQYRDFSIYVSADSIGSWGITYRRIAPSYVVYGHMGIYQRQLGTFDETVLFDNSQGIGMCMNCHTSNHGDIRQRVFHVRVENGATVLHIGDDHAGATELLQARNDSLGGAMVYPAWHPGGRYCAFSTNKTSQMFHTSGNKRIEVYDSSSDVFVYDTETHAILKDTLIMQTYWAENCPQFSPDGQWLFFTTARRQLYPTDFDKERYSLCRVAFDAATGTLGTQVDTLVNTRLTGKSVSWARLSPDGRFVVYAQADYGYFTIWHPEADLWLLDLITGQTRPLDEVNSLRAESFSAWSRDKWFLFTSRRDDGLYSRIYFSQIDSTGRATKPFMLPQRNPKEYYRRLMDSYNTPDFVAEPVIFDKQQLYEQLCLPQRVATHVNAP